VRDILPTVLFVLERHLAGTLASVAHATVTGVRAPRSSALRHARAGALEAVSKGAAREVIGVDHGNAVPESPWADSETAAGRRRGHEHGIDVVRLHHATS
jgi:hypothetical protein